ncbi:MAG TPA: DUF6600 domain-containing protein [Candidatus Bathyarchaeia archaeon]|nr:DUF6600 domain-containing protein [Candidatus Bathyarchaeia archaeon]
MRKIGPLFALTLFFAALFATLPTPAAAQDEDPPSRVARLNYVQGSVSYQVSGDQNWVQADPNRPLTTGDNLWVDQDSRGEVHIGSTAIRMASQTGISFLTLDDRTVQLQLAQGTIEVHLRRLAPGEAFEIDTPNLALTLTRSGEYRVETDPNGSSTVIVVREGEGEVTGGESWDLVSGQQYTLQGTDQLTYDASPAPDFDDFENWCQSRDDRENQSASAKYVSRDVDGYYDLDDYGDWRTDPDYGAIWVPRGVAVGWAPYQLGHWVYVAPWGWTWVDDEPWGFAPFHYGRWAFVGGYWGWVPGPVVVRPVYAPALVAFVGGGGFSFSVAFGGGFSGVAWFPLGPRDVYVPGYHCSARYVQTINVTNTRVVNVTQVTNVYNNVVINRNTTYVNDYTYARNERAVTAVSRDTFVNARPVSKAVVHVTAAQLQAARPVDTAPIAPTRTSYVSATARVATAKPATPFEQRPVVARLNPAVSRPAPVYTNDTRPFNHPQPTQPQAQGGTPPSNNGFRPFTPPSDAARGGNAGQPQQEQQSQRQQYTERPSMKYTPPPKARDEMYDVHPPLNQKQAQPPKQEEHRAPPPAEKPKEENKKEK